MADASTIVSDDHASSLVEAEQDVEHWKARALRAEAERDRLDEAMRCERELWEIFADCRWEEVWARDAALDACAARIDGLMGQNRAARTVCEHLMEQLELANKNSNAYRDAHMAYQRWASKLAPDAVGDAAKREAIGSTSAEVQRLTTRRDELLALVARISQETPLPDEVQNALAQRGALLAEVGTLRASLSEATATAEAFNAERVAAGREVVRLRADRDHLRAALDIEIDGRAEALIDCAALTEERNALLMARAARRMEPEEIGPHAMVGDYDCERCGEGMQHYLHTDRDDGEEIIG